MRVVMVVLVLVSAPLAVLAKQPPEAKVFLETRYRSIESLRELPPQLAAAFRRQVHGAPVADRGEPFRATDVVLGGDPPTRRFLVAGTSPSGSFVAYEHGGRGHHYHLVLFGAEAPEPPALASCTGLHLALPRSARGGDSEKQARFGRLIQTQISRDLRAGACEATNVDFDF
jgi:hypothetical protein